MKKGALLTIMSHFAFIIAYNCNSPEGNGPESEELMNHVTLENQAEHSGILVKLVELDTVVFTDSTGYFNFGKLPDGSWTLKAKYPYFSPIEESVIVRDSVVQTTIDIQLKQLLQFWIEPADTTISMDQGNSTVFTFTLQTKLVNINNERVTVRGVLNPRQFFAIRPQDFQWPFVPNPDNRTEFCYEHYEWFGATDAFDLFEFHFDPGDTISLPAKYHGGWFLKSCFNPGTYLVFSAPSDHWNNPEYFDPAYFWDQEKDPLPPAWAWEKSKQLNKTLLLKRELFQPATITLIE